MSAQYLRKYRLLIGTTNPSRAYDASALRCAFKIGKSLNDEPGYSEISLFNPAPDTVAGIKKGARVILEAGYESGYYGMIFTGDIVWTSYRRQDETTTELHLLAQDGDAFLKTSFTAGTLARGATAGSAVNWLLNGAASGTLTDGLSDKPSPRGAAYFGLTGDCLRGISRANSAQFYIEDGAIHIVKAKDYGKSTAVELNGRTGLIGRPAQTEDGISGECLINPRIKLNTLIHLNADLVEPKAPGNPADGAKAPSPDGIYRIVKLTYEGDTHGEDWLIRFDAVTQVGAKPVAMDAKQTTLFR